MVLMPGCRCCVCSGCAEPVQQLVVEYEPGGGSGVILEDSENIIPGGVFPWGNGMFLRTREYKTECGGDPFTYVVDIAGCNFGDERDTCVSLTTQTSGDLGDRTTCDPPENAWELGEGQWPFAPLGFPRSDASGELCPCIYAEVATISVSVDFNIDTQKPPLVIPPTVFPNEGLLGIEKVSLRSSAGYPTSVAVNGRVRVARARDRKPPTVLLPVGATGTGGALAPVLEQYADKYGQPYWGVVGATVTQGGSGYSVGTYPVEIDGSTLWPQYVLITEVDENGTITAAGVNPSFLAVGLSEFEVERTRTGPPIVEAIPPATVTGATLAVSLNHTGTGETQYWSVASVTATSVGEGWEDGDAIQIRCTNGVTEQHAEALAVMSRVEPEVTASVPGKTGTTFDVSLSLLVEGIWEVSSVAVSGELVGFDDGTPLTFATDGTANPHANAYIATIREEPTVTADVSGGGSGAVLSVQLSKTGNTWGVDSVTVDDGGEGYADGALVTFEAGSGDTTGQAAEAVVFVEKAEPSITASVSGGSGASLSVSVSKDGSNWGVSAVSVTAGGTGYADGASVDFSADSGDVEVSAASAVVQTKRFAPTLTASVAGGGSGASLSVAVSPTSGGDGRPAWYVSSIAIDDAGDGYAENDPISVSISSGYANQYSYFSAYVSQVDGSGAITAVAIDSGGEYFDSDGEIDSVQIDAAGAYYHTDGVIESVGIYYPGEYWHPTTTIDSVVVGNPGSYYDMALTGIDVTKAGKYYQYNYTVTENPVVMPNCKDYETWDTLDDAPTGPAVGESYGNQIPIYDATVFGWTPTRRCAFGTLSVSVQ